MIKFAPETKKALLMQKKTLLGAGLIFVGSVFIPMAGYSQTQSKDIDLANEYYTRHDFEKSLELYDKLAKDPANGKAIYANYLAVLSELKQDEKTERFLKKMAKAYPQQFEYKIDLALLYQKQKKDDKANKIFSRLFEDIEKKSNIVEYTADYLVKVGLLDKAELLYKESRKAMFDPYAYNFKLAEIHKRRGETSQMIDELLLYLDKDPSAIFLIENSLQTQLTKPEELDMLQKTLYERVQTDASNLIYNELLMWLFLQRKDFDGAFIQAKAIDKRGKLPATKVLEVGTLSMSNKDYKSAVSIFEYVVQEYAAVPSVYAPAQRQLIEAREQAIKNVYPIDKQAIKALVEDYKKLMKILPDPYSMAESQRSIALLYGHYLGQPDTAIFYLNKAVTVPRYNRQFVSKCKLDLGDMYLLKNEPWEATLLYSQVEKDEKDQPLGYEAKLRNAKLSYYKGEFDLAQDHLDVLKLATSREIANDALDLSLMIQDNTAFDSTGAALAEYSKIELLLFENKDEEALAKCDELLKKYPKSSLDDEVYWLRAKVYRRMKKFDKAIENLDVISKDYASDIFADDALFMKGVIYEEDLQDKEKAMETYQNLMKTFPASIFTAEARKKYRILRGDFVN
ncbi:tetratricopeptide repeat protein [Flexibacter flexilis]|nr:tetratricopeptide repeat protein [Flexibacter flexilis]